CFINSTIDLNNVTVTSTAEVCKGWYVVVNVSIQDGLPLPGANVTAFVNSSGDKEVTATTGGDGLAYLPVIEQVKNASSTTTVTPHNITVAYSSSISGDFKNTTVVNASGNLVVNLSLAINCTAPLDNTYINKNTVLCPGSFYVANGIIINQSSLQVTCDNTKIIATNSALNKGVYSKGKTGVNVTSCWVEDFYYGLSLLDSSSWILNNITVLSNSQGIYFSNTSSTVISHSNITENSIGIYFGSYYYQRHGNYTIYNNTFSSNGYTLYFYINPALNGANPNISTIYHNTFMTSSTYDVYRYLSSSSDFKTFPSNFNITINNSGTLTNVGNSWDYICNLNFVDADGDGWYDSGSDYPYNLTNYNSYDPGVDYYPQVVSCPASEIFLGSSSSSSSSSSSGDSPSAAVATTAAESVTTTASYSTAADVAAALSASFSGGSLSITNRGDKTATVDVSFDLGIENKDAVIAQLKKQGYEGERLKLKLAAVSTDTDSPLGRSYSYFGLIGPGKEVPYNIGYKITSGQVEGGLLGQIFNDRQLTIPPGETVTLDVAVEGGLNVGARTVTVSFQAFGETVLEKEVVIESKVVTGVAADQRQEDGLVDFYIFIGKENGGDAAPDTITDESTNEITGAAVSNPSTKPTYEFEYSIDKGVSTEFADIATFTSLSNNTLFVQQLHYAGLSAGERTIHTKLRKDGKTVAENSFPISIPASSDAEIGDSAALAGEATGIIHRILLIIFGSGLLVLLLLPIIYFFLFRQRPVSLEQPVLPLKPAYQDSSIPQKPVQNIPEQLYRQESGKITELMKKVHHLDITLEDEKKKKKNSKITELMKRVHHLDISLEDKKLKKKNDNDGEYEHELSYIEQELQKLK
ncbi:MAG TPA: hypothetical protein VJI15_06055, partial [Candidatus Nanoarchaeia archaeon]|nr:hypothetical protein [Candidatus Nanoarchaeia archaeon]